MMIFINADPPHQHHHYHDLSHHLHNDIYLCRGSGSSARKELKELKRASSKRRSSKQGGEDGGDGDHGDNDDDDDDDDDHRHLFWNQVLTWVSLRAKAPASSTRSGVER